MSKTTKVIRREYLNIVKKKSFIISAILTPILMIGLLFLPALLSRVEVIQEKKVAVMDGTDYVFAGLEESKARYKLISKMYDEQMAALEKSGNEDAFNKQIEKEAEKIGMPGGKIGRFLMEEGAKAAKSFGALDFIKVETTGKDWEKVKEDYLRRIRQEKVDVLLIIPAGVERGSITEYYATSSANFEETSLLRNAISDIIVNKRINDQGMDPVKIKELTAGVQLKTTDVTKTGTKTGGFLANYLLAIAFVMLLFTAVNQTGMHLLRGVLEEKNNRIIEILLSSIKSNQLMKGKIIGLGAAGLTLVIIWIAAGLIGLQLSGGFGISISAEAWIYFALFFILGYLLFSTFMALLGAVMNSEQEAQHFITIIILMMLVPMFFAPTLIRGPNSTLATVLTMIPLFTATTIVFRISITPIPLWEVLLAMVILVLFTTVMVKLTSKVFRVGILMYGKKPSFKEIRKWLKYK